MTNIKVIVKEGKAQERHSYPGRSTWKRSLWSKSIDSLIPNLEIERGKVTFIYSNLKQ